MCVYIHIHICINVHIYSPYLYKNSSLFIPLHYTPTALFNHLSLSLKSKPMGNYVSSCSTLISPTSKAARVIFPGGEIRQFRHPVKAAELMLESPNFFLVNSKSLNIGKRFSALSADEDLEFGNIYIMFPMRRLNSVVTGGDMAVLFMAANSAAKRISGGNNKVGVLPELAPAVTSDAGGSSRLNLDEVEGLSTLEFKYRLSVSRSRKPSLDTITEEPISSR